MQRRTKQFLIGGAALAAALALPAIAQDQPESILPPGFGLARPLMPVDETRYAAVAWEMWTRGDFIVPRLDGLPYDHKPPLLFWLTS